MNNEDMNPVRILIVDDQPSNIDILVDFLEIQGYE